jgi:hypothetical protein
MNWWRFAKVIDDRLMIGDGSLYPSSMLKRPNNIKGANTKCEGSLNNVATWAHLFSPKQNSFRLYHWHLQYFCRQDSLETGQNPQCYCNSSSRSSSYGRLLLLLLCVWWLRNIPEMSMRSVCLLVPSIHSRTCVHRFIIIIIITILNILNFLNFLAGGSILWCSQKWRWFIGRRNQLNKEVNI